MSPYFSLTTDTGTNTREYVTLLESLSSVTEKLFSVPRSKDQLCIKFIERKWLDITANPSERELVILALSRIKENSQIFYEFVKILEDIGGMNLVVKSLTTKLKEHKV